MLISKKQKFIVSLLLVLTLFLNSCARDCSSTVSPVWPVAGEKVANELEPIAGSIPNTIEWLGRLDKLRQELQLYN